MTAGESAGDRANAMRAAARRYRQRADRVEQVADKYQKGEAGEMLTSSLLGQLAAKGFVHLDDRRLPTSEANLDHVVVGPPGVLVVDSKNWSGSVEVDRRSLRQHGRRRDNTVEAARTQAVALSESLEAEALGHKTPVWPIVCFVGEARVGGHKSLDRVHLLDVDDLLPFILSRPRALSGRQVDDTLATVLRVLPRRSDEADMPATPVAAPPEVVVFLESWRKAGRHRLYVKASDGEQVGYLDLRNGEVHAATSKWEPILGQLLPHYVQGDTPGIAAADMSEDARGTLRRFIDSLLGRQDAPLDRPSIIAAYRWRGHGKNRLYLHRLDAAGGKTTLGWFDVDRGRYSCDQPDTANVLAYCGQRYQAMAQTGRA